MYSTKNRTLVSLRNGRKNKITKPEWCRPVEKMKACSKHGIYIVRALAPHLGKNAARPKSKNLSRGCRVAAGSLRTAHLLPPADVCMATGMAFCSLGINGIIYSGRGGRVHWILPIRSFSLCCLIFRKIQVKQNKVARTNSRVLQYAHKLAFIARSTHKYALATEAAE